MDLQLTKSEERVIKLKARGFLAKQICDKLYLSIHTVKMHTKNALKRNNVTNGFELVARYAITHPDLFKTVIVALFLSIQSFMIIDHTDYDLRRVRKTTKIVKVKKC